MTTPIRNAVFVIILGASTGAQAGRPSPASIRAHDLTINSFTSVALNTLARKYHVVIGQYGTLADSETYHAVHISIKSGTLGDAFDAIVKDDSRLEWKSTSNGAIHFIIRGLPAPTLLETTIRSLDLKNPPRGTASLTLGKIPEVAAWLHDHGCVMGESFTDPLPEKWRNLVLHEKNVAVATLLDEIAAKSQTYHWFAVHYGSDPCRVNLTP